MEIIRRAKTTHLFSTNFCDRPRFIRPDGTKRRARDYCAIIDAAALITGKLFNGHYEEEVLPEH